MSPGWILPSERKSLPRARQRSILIKTYRELLSIVLSPRDSFRLEPRSRGYEDRALKFVDSLIDTLDTRFVWARAARSLPPALKLDLFARMALGGKVNRDIWPAVKAKALYKFERSYAYLTVLAIVATVSIVAFCYGAMLATGGQHDGALSPLVASLLCVLILASWTWMRAESNPSSAFGGIDQDALFLAVLGFFLAPIWVYENIKSPPRLWSEVSSLVTVGFMPAVCWLMGGAVSQIASVLAALITVVFLATVGLSIVVVGNRYEKAHQTPLVGLFLDHGL